MVDKTCIDCGKIIGYKAERCRSCWAIYQASVASKRFSGISLSDEHKAKIKAGNLGKISPIRGKKYSEEEKLKLYASRRGPRSKQAKQNMSIAQKKVYRETDRKIIGNIHRWIEYDGQKFRYGYEAAYAEWLDSQNIKWQHEPKRFILKNTTYTPDFYLPEFDKYIEIKGYFPAEAYFKIRNFIRSYPKINFQILFREDLIQLGVNYRW